MNAVTASNRSSLLKRAGFLCALTVVLGVTVLAWGCGSGAQKGKSNHAANSVSVPLRPGLAPGEKLTVFVDPSDFLHVVAMYSELTGRSPVSATNGLMQQIDGVLGDRLTAWRMIDPAKPRGSGIVYHRDGRLSAAELKEELDGIFGDIGLQATPVGVNRFQLMRSTPQDSRR